MMMIAILSLNAGLSSRKLIRGDTSLGNFYLILEGATERWRPSSFGLLMILDFVGRQKIHATSKELTLTTVPARGVAQPKGAALATPKAGLTKAVQQRP